MIPNKIILFSADASLVRIVKTCLIEAGYQVVHASQGVGAIELVRLEKPAMVILDWDLPGINSLAIIRSLRSEEQKVRIPVILMGDSMREEDALIGLEVGADLCLLETFHPQVFVARVRSLIRRSEPSKALTMILND
jgi:DNA-binding response OmpR family regulator